MLLAGGKSDRYFCTFCISTNLSRHDNLVLFVFQDPKNPKSAMFGTDVVAVSFSPMSKLAGRRGTVFVELTLYFMPFNRAVKLVVDLSSFVNILRISV